MRKFVFLAAAAVLAVSTPVVAQTIPVGIPAVIPAASSWVDIPALAPAVTDVSTRQRMNQDIVTAIAQANGNQEEARRAIAVIVNRYQDAAQAQSARTRPGPK